jgi:hypothetical protein
MLIERVAVNASPLITLFQAAPFFLSTVCNGWSMV